MIARTISSSISFKLFQGKAIIVTGPRQAGKTTLIKHLLHTSGKEFLRVNGEDPRIADALPKMGVEELKQYIGQNKIVFVDEAQKIEHMGRIAKLIVDELPEIQVILSGSSSFELFNALQEPLTGRKWTFELFPISWEEWQNHIGSPNANLDLEKRLVLGMYPEVLTSSTDAELRLREIVDSYLYKDVLSYAGIRKPEVLKRLLQALARQVGQEVVYTEVSQLVGIDPKTLGVYIDVLEKAYVLFKLPAFSRNLRNEIKANKKIFFYDNGVRNAIINNLSPLELRNDVGALWENFLMSERLKLNAHYQKNTFMYFWRTKQQQEVDLVEESNGEISGYEFKWKQKNAKISQTFWQTYNAKTQIVTRDNFESFLNIKTEPNR